MGPLISTASLAAALDDAAAGRLVVLDATTTLPGERFDPEAAFRDGHIAGAARFVIDEFSDPDTDLPHMAPSAGRFATLIGAKGVGNDTDLVFYDQTGVASAARAWWLARLFGHERVRVLDGGLPAWRAEGRALVAGPPAVRDARRFEPRLHARRLVGLGDMIAASGAAAAAAATGDANAPVLLDARSRGRFDASVPEPRAGLPGGHVPGATSLPFGLLLDGTRFRPATELRDILADVGVRHGRPVITSCGSGLTASVLSLALVAAGFGQGALYDGSWTEWAQTDLPRETGPAA